MKGQLHLITQDNQPYGSTRKCCEKCGLWVGAFSTNGDRYYSHREDYTKENAEKMNLTLCDTAK